MIFKLAQTFKRKLTVATADVSNISSTVRTTKNDKFVHKYRIATKLMPMIMAKDIVFFGFSTSSALNNRWTLEEENEKRN
jgi:hypothetical protein